MHVGAKRRRSRMKRGQLRIHDRSGHFLLFFFFTSPHRIRNCQYQKQVEARRDEKKFSLTRPCTHLSHIRSQLCWQRIGRNLTQAVSPGFALDRDSCRSACQPAEKQRSKERFFFFFFFSCPTPLLASGRAFSSFGLGVAFRV